MSSLPTPPLQAGDQVGRLTLLSKTHHPKGKKWRCRCRCGTAPTVWEHNLRTGRTRSCGCLFREMLGKASTIHGEARTGQNTTEYMAWRRLRRDYQVCARWRESFPAFLAAVGRRPSPQHCLARIKKGQIIGPGMLAWRLRKEATQLWVKGRQRIGKESHTIPEWGRLVGISRTTIYNRLATGLPLKEAVFTARLHGGRPRRASVA